MGVEGVEKQGLTPSQNKQTALGLLTKVPRRTKRQSPWKQSASSALASAIASPAFILALRPIRQLFAFGQLEKARGG